MIKKIENMKSLNLEKRRCAVQIEGWTQLLKTKHENMQNWGRKAQERTYANPIVYLWVLIPLSAVNLHSCAIKQASNGMAWIKKFQKRD